MGTPDGIRFEIPAEKNVGGVISLRKTVSRRSQTSYDEKQVTSVEKDVESLYGVDEAPSIRETDYKRKQVFTGWTLLWLAYQSTGVIYGDIGTSPLYVYSSTFPTEPTKDDLLGALSLIIWSITLIVTIKYIVIVLACDDEGEGGTFAMYNLLSRYCNIAKHDPKTAKTVHMQRHLSGDMSKPSKTLRDWLERSRFAHGVLKALAVFGVSMVLADSVLTPAQSVLGAIQGLKVVDDTISTGTIVGTSCAILVLLFLLQPFGISKLGSFFAPVVIVWLLLNFTFGIYNLVKYDHAVLKAFSPYFAGLYFVRNKTEGWKSLGGILLAFTGVEALFADLGAFSARAIRISWCCFCYPCLLFAYIGQAAYISENEGAYSNPFFNSVPPGMFYPSLVISILAAVVASQALITSTFQLLTQVMNTSYFPQIKVVYTSTKFHGQVYIPMANWLMMIGTVVVTAVYNNTTRLGFAYGVCVIIVTFITTCMVALVAIIVWRRNWILVIAIWLPIVTLDALFLTSALTKVPHGAWFTLMLAVILASIFILWRYGKEAQWSSESRDRVPLSQLVVRSNNKPYLSARYGSAELTLIKGLGIFFDKAGDLVPTVYEEFLRKFEAQQEVHVFLHMRALSKPHVQEDEMFTVSRTSVTNCYRLVVRHGYNDRVVTPDLGRLVYEKVREALLTYAVVEPPSTAATSTDASSSSYADPSAPSGAASTSTSTNIPISLSTADDGAAAAAVAAAAATENPVNASVARRVAALDKAFATQVVYLVGKEQLKLLTDRNNWFKRCVLGVFLWIRENTRAKIAKMEVPVSKLVEVGFVKEI